MQKSTIFHNISIQRLKNGAVYLRWDLQDNQHGYPRHDKHPSLNLHDYFLLFFVSPLGMHDPDRIHGLLWDEHL